MSIEKKKNALRSIMRRKREEIPPFRRLHAARDAVEVLSSLFKSYRTVLSFASFRDEIDTSELNLWLAQEKRLLLPKVDHEWLRIYHVEDPLHQLQRNRWGIPEPNPVLCREISGQEVSFVLVPGLAFDRLHHRLGYGNGYYDRLLTQTPSPAYGLGFREQFHTEDLPITDKDVSLSGIFLF